MGRILLLIELKGGNDGLNTVIPYADPRYRELRPDIAVAREHTIQLDEATGLHGKLEPLMESWKAGDLAIVQGVGYPMPNRSHFRSIEIWDTASSASQTISEGWIAQAFRDGGRPPGAGVDSIVLDSNALPCTGPALRTIVMRDAENFLHQARALKATARGDDGNPALRHLLAVRQEINAAAQELSDRLRSAPAPAETYPEELRLGRQFDLATRLLAARVPIVALKGALGGFDTHANQAPTHERLLSVLAANLAMLRRNLIAAGCWDKVVVATYSEFGRRAAQNGSAGTDHGTAAPMLVMGGRVQGGLHGAAASLTELDDSDLRHTVDFRDVFATLARGCWGSAQDFGVARPRRLALFADA